MNSSPSAYLKVTRRASNTRGIMVMSSCSTCTHSTGPMPSGKMNRSGSENGGSVKKPRSLSHTMGGLRHSSIMVQTENTVANGTPSMRRSPPTRMLMSWTSSNRCLDADAANTWASPGLIPCPTSASRPRSRHAASIAN